MISGSRFSRRLLLGGGLVLAASPLAACSGGGDPLPKECRTPEALTQMATLAGAPLVYAENGREQSFHCDPRFVELLESWAGEWVAAAGLGPLVKVSTFGAYVDKCPSWHAAGRAFDIAELVHANGQVSCRYDQWGDDPQRLRAYWRLAASLSTRFTYTLGYPYNAAHHNHLHVDNGVNGYGATRFDQRSNAQTCVVQGALLHIFGRDVEITGDYDRRTRDAVSSVQEDLGLREKLTSEEGWRAFLAAAVAEG